MHVRRHDLAAQKDGRVGVTRDVVDADGVAAVFVAVWEVIDKVAGSGEACLLELLGAHRSCAGECADRRVGGDRHATIVQYGGRVLR